jgi:hypothetical protein
MPVEQWRPGDVIVQRHRLALPQGTPGGVYRLQTGAYWLDTLARWTVEGGGDHIILAEVQVVE